MRYGAGKLLGKKENKLRTRHKMSGDSSRRIRESEEKTQMHSYVVLIILSTAWLHDASCLVMRRAGCRPFLFRSVHKDKLLKLTTRLYDFRRETLPAVLRQQQLVSQVAARPCASMHYNSGCKGS